MTTQTAALINTRFADIAETEQYKDDLADTSLDKFTGTNISAANATLTVRIVPDGEAVDAKFIVKKTVAPGATYTFPELVGQILEPGDKVSTACSHASAIVIRASGRKFT